MNKSIRVLIDYGGTIANDSLLFDKINAMSLGNPHNNYKGPDSWDDCRQLGSENYFDKIEESYFSISEYYSESINVINNFHGVDGEDSKYLTYIVFDNIPKLKRSLQDIEKSLVFDFNRRAGKVNGFYIDSDKLSLCKRIGADVLIDDDPRIALSVASAGIKSIVLLRKWNSKIADNDYLNLFIPKKKRKEIESNLMIAEDWNDVRNILKGMEN